MSLYHEAVQVLNTAAQNGGSIKSIVFGQKDWKTDPKTLFALSTESAKWSALLSEAIENSGVLKIEKQLTPELALVLSHDLLLAKRGLALPPKHGFAVTISKHRARLTAELSKARIRRGFASLDALKTHINSHGSESNSNGASSAYRHPRWVRVNTILTSQDEQLQSTFLSYQRANSVTDITHAAFGEKLIYIDEHIPDLLAIPDHTDITSNNAYKQGQLILQDKASCFPAVLLDIKTLDGNVIDACAAPGNKTTHLACLLSSSIRSQAPGAKRRKIFACERDGQRAATLSKMVKVAAADDVVQVRARQDFLKLSPSSPELANVTAILLDPSCSGSGIVGRDEATLNLHLPSLDAHHEQKTIGKKRKRHDKKADTTPAKQVITTEEISEETPDMSSTEDSAKLAARLSALSFFQLRLLEHAMSFPAVTRITYSTCSLHDEENEHVVVKALMSDAAVKGGWRILRPDEQVPGLRKWHKRGKAQGILDGLSASGEWDGRVDVDVVAEACIRCDKGSEDGTMGFFVVGFTRNSNVKDRDNEHGQETELSGTNIRAVNAGQEEDEWEGFSDEG